MDSREGCNGMDLAAAMDFHNNDIGCKTYLELVTRYCAVNVGFRRRLGYCLRHHYSKPSSERMFSALLSKVRSAKFANKRQANNPRWQVNDGKLWFFNDRHCKNGCGNGRCVDHKCVCNNDWTGTTCQYQRRRRRRRRTWYKPWSWR